MYIVVQFPTTLSITPVIFQPHFQFSYKSDQKSQSIMSLYASDQIGIFRPLEGGMGPQDQSAGASSPVGRVSPNMGVLVRGRYT